MSPSGDSGRDPARTIEAHVDADADLITRLGEELFTDSLQALLELVKNSYDADAQRIRVEIERHWRPPGYGDPERAEISDEDAAEPEVAQRSRANDQEAGADQVDETEDKSALEPGPLRTVGRLRILDDGSGMDQAAIARGWLVISASPKRAQKASGERTRLNRTPLGDKGLGRLGAQRLGTVLTVRTRPRPEQVELTSDEYWAANAPLPEIEHRVTLDFRYFRRGVQLSRIPVTWQSDKPAVGDDWSGPRPWGTILELEGLKNVDDWLDEDRLRRELSRLLNPYEQIGRFQLAVDVDGNTVDAERVGRRVRESALGRYLVTYRHGELTVTGRLRPGWLNPQGGSDELARALQADGGEAFRERLAKVKALRMYEIDAASDGWLLQFSRTTPVEQVKGLENGEDCGPFKMDLDQLALQLVRAGQIVKLEMFSKQDEYRDWIAERAGVPIYRDGFHVAPASDLLRLGEGFTGGGSWYGLRPQNVMGYIAISAAENARLEETTDREDFRNTPAYRRFRALLAVARDHINGALDDIGREGVIYNRSLTANKTGAADTSPRGVVDEARRVVRSATSARQAVASAASRADAVLRSPVLSEEERGLQKQVADELGRAAQVLGEVEKMAPLTEVLASDIESLDTRYQELYETTGLGIVAEALAHDLAHVIQRLQQRGRQAKAALTGLPQAPAEVDLLIREVESATRALRGQLRHLDPQMRGARTRREVVSLGRFLKELTEYHRERLRTAGIAVELNVRASAAVFVAPGRLTQVIDNLLINSEFWLSHDDRNGRAEPPSIFIELEGTSLRIRDNGPGIPPEMAASVFEPFVSSKHEGRGLGLFIVRQLLETEQAEISLTRSKPDGPFDTFEIDLANARRSSE